jgi:hypothetical protein
LRNIPATISIAIELWNTYLSQEGFPKVLKTTPAREKHFKARVSEEERRNNALWWWALIGKIGESAFLKESAGKWFCFDWVLNESNLTKILEGKYDDRETTDGSDLIPVLIDEVAI